MNKSGVTPMETTYISEEPDDTRRFAEALFQQFGPGKIWALHGDLGAGKTCLIQGLALALGVREPVTSPTFALVHEYEGTVPLIHLDLYRLSGPEDILALGWDDYMESPGIVAVEWAERASGLFPAGTLHIDIQMDARKYRRIFRVCERSEPS